MLVCFISIGAVACAGISFLPWMNANVSCSIIDQTLDVVVYPHSVDTILYACIGQLIVSLLFCSLIWKLAVMPNHPRLCKAITCLWMVYGAGIFIYVQSWANVNDSMTNYAKSSYINQYSTCNDQTDSDTTPVIFIAATTTFWRQSYNASIYLELTAIVGCLLRHMCCSPSSKYC